MVGAADSTSASSTKDEEKYPLLIDPSDGARAVAIAIDASGKLAPPNASSNHTSRGASVRDPKKGRVDARFLRNVVAHVEGHNAARLDRNSGSQAQAQAETELQAQAQVRGAGWSGRRHPIVDQLRDIERQKLRLGKQGVRELGVEVGGGTGRGANRIRKLKRRRDSTCSHSASQAQGSGDVVAENEGNERCKKRAETRISAEEDVCVRRREDGLKISISTALQTSIGERTSNIQTLAEPTPTDPCLSTLVVETEDANDSNGTSHQSSEREWDRGKILSQGRIKVDATKAWKCGAGYI